MSGKAIFRYNAKTDTLSKSFFFTAHLKQIQFINPVSCNGPLI